MPEIRHTPRALTATTALAAGAAVDPHHHDDHQIVYAGRGVLSVTTAAGRWVAPATRALWIPAGTVHQHRAHGATDLCTVGLPARRNPLGLRAPAVLPVSPLLRELILACTRPADDEPATDGPARARLRRVLVDQLRGGPEQPIRLPAPRDPRLVAACAELERDPADPVGLGELGARVGAGERTLSRLFAAELGMSFPRWRTQVRLHRALVLLAEGTPVTAVAHRCGWASTSAFIDAYRATFGHTPGRASR